MARLRFALAATLAFVVPLAVFVASLKPGIDYWDTGELQTVPYILGIAHPSGFPAYVLFGWLWSHVVPFGDVAYRMNLLSAVGMAGASLAIAGVLREWDVEPVFALGAALVFAFARVPWDHAIHADVHAVELGVVGAAFWLAVRWVRTGSRGVLLGAAAATGLALAVHSSAVLIAPGIVLAAFGRRPPLRAAALAVVLGGVIVATCYAYLPIRSRIVTAQRLDPTVRLGIEAGRPFWDNDHPATLAGFVREVGGGEFGAGHALRSIFDPQVLAELPRRYGRAAIGDLALGVLLIGLAGAYRVIRRDPAAGIGLLTAGILPVLFVLAYPAESDIERYFLPSYWMIGVLLGAGAELLARGGMERAPAGVVGLIGVLFAFVAGTNVYVGRDAFAPAGAPPAQRAIDRVAAQTPANAVIVAPWTYATPLAYGAYVEGELGARILVTGWPIDYLADYGRWLLDRPVIVVSDESPQALALPHFSLTPIGVDGGPHIYRLRAAP